MKTIVMKGGVRSIQLTIDNMEEVEILCNGRIRGTKLPIEKRIVQFDPCNHYLGEQEIRVGDWLVQFYYGERIIENQVWPDKIYKELFVPSSSGEA